VTTLTHMERHAQWRGEMTSPYNKFKMEESLHHSVEKHLGKVLEEHIDRAHDGVAEVDLAQIIERFSIQAFHYMAFGQVGRHGSDTGKGSLTNYSGPGRVGRSIHSQRCLPGSTGVHDDDHVSMDPNLRWRTFCFTEARSISCLW
jgi:hypothetical protein